MMTLIVALLLLAQDEGAPRKDQEKDWKKLEASRAGVFDRKWRSHALMAFEGKADDLKERWEAHIEKDEKKIEKLEPLKERDEGFVYLLWGSSRNGLDPKRRIRVEAKMHEEDRVVRITVTQPIYKDVSGFGGTTDMQYVGWKVALGEVTKGEMKIEIYLAIETYENPGDKNPKKSKEKLDRTLEFEVEK